MMDRHSGKYQSRSALPVRISLNGEHAFEAHLFVANGGRLSDLLNDERQFLPLEHSNGTSMVIAKSQICSITEIDHKPQAQAPATEQIAATPRQNDKNQPVDHKPETPNFDPYTILKVRKDASIDEIRRAYKTKMKAVHPDALAGAPTDEQKPRAALVAAQRVNYAYQRILAERNANAN